MKHRYLKRVLTGFVGLKILDAITTQLAFKLCSKPIELNPLAAWYVNANPSLVWAGVLLIGVWSIFVYQLVVKFPRKFDPEAFSIVSTGMTIFTAIVVVNNICQLGFS